MWQSVSHFLAAKIGDECTRREVIEQRVRILVLRVNPLARLRAVLIFQPAIRVNNLDTVDGLPDVILARWRRSLGCLRLHTNYG